MNVKAELDIALDNVKAWAASVQQFGRVSHAAKQGAAAFLPSMLPDLWKNCPRCPYRNPLYKEAWCRGFFSAAAYFLIYVQDS